MEQNNNNPENNQVPNIPESEMKMPEEQFGQNAPVAESKHVFNPLLFGLLIILLVILALVVIWGEQLVELVWPTEIDNSTPTPIEEPAPQNDSAANELQSIEAELNEVDFTDIENDLDAIEAEIEAEASAGASTTTTPQ